MRGNKGDLIMKNLLNLIPMAIAFITKKSESYEFCRNLSEELCDCSFYCKGHKFIITNEFIDLGCGPIPLDTLFLVDVTEINGEPQCLQLGAADKNGDTITPIIKSMFDL